METPDPHDLDAWAAEESTESPVIADLQRKLHRAGQEAREARRITKELVKQMELADERVDLALAISEPTQPEPIKPRRAKTNEACAVFVASDWHVGETVDPDTVNGRNEFHPEAAEQRARRFFQSCLRMLEVYRGGVKVEQAVLAILGDMITGFIHEELVESNSMSPTEELLFVQRLLGEGIGMLLELGGLRRLVIPCVYGNHGRTTPKRRISTGHKNSYEWLMYQSLAQMWAQDDRVEFHVANGAHLYTDVMGLRIRWHHGDDVRYWGGVGGLSIPLRKAVDSWDDFRPADLTVIGHYHQFVDFGYAIVNGSLIGYGPYALSVKARYEPPRQATFLVDAQHGKTLVAPLIVE